MSDLKVQPLTQEAFAPFGDVIEVRETDPSFPINGGTTQRFHDLARAVTSGVSGEIALSIGRATPFPLPLTIDLVERHPLGSQAFVPLSPTRFLVCVAETHADGSPGVLSAFLARPGQGINYHIGTWHGVLRTLDEPTDFLIVDRVGDGDNLEEVKLETPRTITHLGDIE